MSSDLMKVKAETGEQPVASQKPETKPALRQAEHSQVKEAKIIPTQDQQKNPPVSAPASSSEQKGISAEEAQKIFGGKIIEH